MIKLLIVDDEEKVITLYGDVLSQKGFSVFTAMNGKDGVKLAVQEVPDLILLDVNMPGTNGVDVLDLLKNEERTREIPVIFLTSLVTQEEVTDSRGTIGGLYFVSKSAGLQELLRRIYKVVGADCHART